MGKVRLPVPIAQISGFTWARFALPILRLLQLLNPYIPTSPHSEQTWDQRQQKPDDCLLFPDD
jgi:hypothetical protein